MEVTVVSPTPEEFKPLHIIIDNEAEEIEGYYNLHITKDQIELPNSSSLKGHSDSRLQIGTQKSGCRLSVKPS